MATILNIKRVRIIAAQLPALGVSAAAVKPLNSWADREEAALRKKETDKRQEAEKARKIEEAARQAAEEEAARQAAEKPPGD